MTQSQREESEHNSGQLAAVSACTSLVSFTQSSEMAAAEESTKQHMLWRCGGLTFRANFDGGNLGSAQSASESGSFQCTIAPDCQGHGEYETPYRLWYHFAVSGGTAGRTIRVNISGMNHIAKIYNTDLRPLVRVLGRSTKWER